MAATLLRAQDQGRDREPVVTEQHPFADVDDGVYYESAVRWMTSIGNTTGTYSTTFSPEAPVTRAQAAAFLRRFVGSPGAAAPESLYDVPGDAYNACAVGWMVERGITLGSTWDTYSPALPVTRSQVMAFLGRLADAGHGRVGEVVRAR